MNTLVGDRLRELRSALSAEEFVSVSALCDPRPIQRLGATLLAPGPDHIMTSAHDLRRRRFALSLRRL